MKQIVVLGMFLIGCATGPGRPTVRGADLYAHAVELRTNGRALVPSSQQPIMVRTDQVLVDRARDQVFFVEQVVAGCNGGALENNADCTLALLLDQTFVITDSAPSPRGKVSEEGEDMSPVNKARLVLLAAGTALAVGAAKCDAFDGCGTLLGIAAGLDGLVLLLTLGGRD